jgi:hypothetical protein
MDRRGFLTTLLGSPAGLALEEAIPFNRVWFFPQKIRLANAGLVLRLPPEWPYGLRNFTLDEFAHRTAVFDQVRQVWVLRTIAPPDPNVIEALLPKPRLPLQGQD